MERRNIGHEINKIAYEHGYTNVWIFPDKDGLHCASAISPDGIRVSIGCGCKGRKALLAEVKEYLADN